MRVLVTGSAGFVGSHLAEALVAAGHDVIGLDAFVDYYPRTLKEANIAGLRAEPRFRLIEADLRRDDLAPALDGVDVVIHEAAMAGLPRSWTEFQAYMDCNVLGTQRLLDAARTAGIGRFVHISTSSVYGRDAVGDETAPTRPISPYGVTKLAAENLVLAFVESFGFPATILRYFSIFGPRQRPDMAFHRFFTAARQGKPIALYGDGEQTRDFTFVTDIVAATIAAGRQGRPGGVYNVGGGSRVTLNHVLELVSRVAGRPLTIQREPAQKGDMLHTYADTSRARQDLAFAPRVTLEEGLKAQHRWLQTQ